MTKRSLLQGLFTPRSKDTKLKIGVEFVNCSTEVGATISLGWNTRSCKTPTEPARVVLRRKGERVRNFRYTAEDLGNDNKVGTQCRLHNNNSYVHDSFNITL